MNVSSILLNVGDWERYRVLFCAQHGMSPSETRWQSAPAEYPCMVLSCFIGSTSPQRVISCFVYVHDAAQLLFRARQMAPATLGPVVTMQTDHEHPFSPGDRCPGYVADGPQNEAMQEVLPPEEQEADSLKPTLQSISANILALVHELVRVGVTTHERYANVYARFLSLSDQVAAESLEPKNISDVVQKELDSSAESGGE